MTSHLRAALTLSLIAAALVACGSSTSSSSASSGAGPCPPCTGTQYCMQRCVDGGSPEPVCVVDVGGRPQLADGTPVDDCSGF